MQGTRQTREKKSFWTWCCAGALERVCLSFGWRVCSAVRVHLSGCAYHLAGVCAALRGCTWAGALIIWLACVQCCAGALERVCLSFGWHVCSAARVHLSECAYHLAGVCVQCCADALERVLIIWLACVQCCAGALERVCLSFGWRVCSAVRVHLSGCAYHLAGVCAALRGCTWAGALIYYHFAGVCAVLCGCT